MNSNNKKRILLLIEIFRKKSDYNTRLSIGDLTRELESRGVSINDRKTLYDDIKTLSECGYEIDYDNGYYLSDAPFSISEIKILNDSVSSLKNLDEGSADSIQKKLYSFISEKEENELKRLEFHSKRAKSHFINRLEDALDAIRNRNYVIITRKGKEEVIAPIFLHRANDYYYLYYHYQGKDRIYHIRFDNIQSMKSISSKDEVRIDLSTVVKMISESTNSFYGGKSETVTLLFDTSDESLLGRVQDDFPEAIVTKKGVSLKASVSDAFFSKIASYGMKLKIREKNISDQYVAFLKTIYDFYLPENLPDVDKSTPR